MKIVFMGTPDFAVAALEKLYENNYDIAAVFTQPDKPKGRGYKLTPPPVKVLALEHGTPVYQPQSLKKDADEYIEVLRNIAPDAIVVAAYGKILPKEVLELPRLGCVNIHGSLLPEYRGAAPIQQAVLDDKKQTGITTMLMGEGLDTGDILLQSATDIGIDETAAELFDRLSVMGAELILKTLHALERGEITPVKQDESKATYAHMLTKDMCDIDFDNDARAVHKKICGLSDWPCAVTRLDNKRLKLYRSSLVSEDGVFGKPGEIIDEKKFIIACKKGRIMITELQAEGSKRMNTQDYLRGRPVTKGSILGENKE
ncbi:MAG: methionyl-tRNA formyltransferase [Ruminococcus sp.]|nr:methionyl-tRNA formyltransferase [Ruminococcus sp.]